MTQHSTLAAPAMLFTNLDHMFGEPVTVTQEQADRDLAAWQVGRTVWMLLAYDCANGECLDEPETTYNEIMELLPDIDDANLMAQARLVMLACKSIAATK
ncbi:hypothetical protein [Mesorhizobium sp.]|uniref:hypothetical protein n=1 Tax=Mesorhizobium sp. TaxID=1871066 RepID=UPI000FE8AA5D|nr:hypothetical protein [Mesorhizobium sp.]RWO89554.1 MAG: hypothetical protein EOQ96_05180 [Mesorhizobium sp.]